MRTKSYQSIQFLRAIAALAVVAFHTDGNVALYGWTPHAFSRVAHYGEIGVDIFFVISGFVIALVSAGAPPGVRTAREFLAARVARIVPIYWLVSAAFAALLLAAPAYFEPWTFGSTHVVAANLLASFVFVPSLNASGLIAPVLNVGWTLNYEAWFYVVFAVALCVTRRPLALVAAVLAGTSLLRLAHGAGVPFLFYTNPIVLEFVAGCCLGTWYARGARLPLRAALAVLVGVIVLHRFYAPTLTEDNRFVVFGLPAFALVATALSLETRVRWGRLMLRLGDASYSLYLTHLLALPLVLKLMLMADRAHRLPGDAVAAIVVLGAVLAGFACHLWLERPLTRLAARWLVRRDATSRTHAKPRPMAAR